MSTRSGKRLHTSFHEKATSELELVVNSERKTRSKRMKDEADVSMPILKKKRNNYVSYPTDDEMNDNIATKPDEDTKVSRVLRKDTLKELNIGSNTDKKNDKIRARKSRRGKKLSDIHVEETTNVEDLENVPTEVPQPKSKKNKKKKTSVEPHPEENKVELEEVTKKSKKKKKKGKKTSSILIEDVLECNNGKNVLNRSNMSVDSFHSAAGSPQTDTKVQTPKITKKKSLDKRLSTTLTKDDSVDSTVMEDHKNNYTFDKKEKTKIKNTTFDKTAEDSSNNKVDFNSLNVSKTRSTSFCKDNGDTQIKRLSNACNSTYDKNEASTNNIDTLENANDSPIKPKTKQKSIIVFNNSVSDEKPSSSSINQTGLNETRNSSKKTRMSLKNTTFDKINEIVNTTYENEATVDKKDSTFDKSTPQINTTFEKVINKVNETYEKPNDTTFEKDTSSTFDNFKKGALKRKSSIIDATFDKSNTSIASLTKEDFEKDKNISSSSYKRTTLHRLSEKANNSTTEVIDTLIEKTTDNIETRNSLHRTSSINNKLNSTFDKGEPKMKEDNSKSSLISSDNSNITEKSDDLSRISITSDDTTENIINTTPVLIESSMEASQDNISKIETPVAPQPPLKREGTFTKDEPTMPETSVTPSKPRSLPAAGCTPFNVNKSSQKKSVLNVTRSLEKRPGSMELAPRLTRVMFCSPVDNPMLATTEKRKIIKSNLKGSNKSFVFDESVSAARPTRKRSYTHSDVDEARVKRTRLTEDLQHSVNRLSRPRTASATAKLTATPTKKPVTPSRAKSEGKPTRTKLPNFAALHQRRFDKMESLDECQERKAKRAKHLLTPTGSTKLLGRISPTNNTEVQKPPAIEAPKTKEKTDTSTKKLPTLESLRPGFTRFGFKLNLDVNPFSVPSKTEKEPKPNGDLKLLKSKGNNTKPGLVKPAKAPLPSLTGTTSVRREVAKQTVMREKSFTDRRSVNRKENRTIIKGVRTNRRFELQMKLRNLE